MRKRVSDRRNLASLTYELSRMENDPDVQRNFRRVRPLVSPVFEFKLLGRFETAVGAVTLVAGLVADGSLGDLLRFLVSAAFFGGVMYLIVYRRFVKKAATNPGPAPTAEREPASRTRRRAAVNVAFLALLFALAIATGGNVGVVAGILVGNGVAIWCAGNWLAAREREIGPLLREPRYRFRGERSRFGGRGIMDARDFYVASVDRVTNASAPAPASPGPTSPTSTL